MSLVFDKHTMWKKYTYIMFISSKVMRYLCNMKFLRHNKRRCVFLLCCFFPSDFESMLHKKVFLVTVCDIMSLMLLFDDEKRRNFSTQTFASSHLLLSMIFEKSKQKRLITLQRSC